jgi:hypothetical protein
MTIPIIPKLLILPLSVVCLTAITACHQEPLPRPEPIPAPAAPPPVQIINREVIIVTPALNQDHTTGATPAAPVKKEVSPCR